MSCTHSTWSPLPLQSFTDYSSCIYFICKSHNLCLAAERIHESLGQSLWHFEDSILFPTKLSYFSLQWFWNFLCRIQKTTEPNLRRVKSPVHWGSTASATPDLPPVPLGSSLGKVAFNYAHKIQVTKNLLFSLNYWTFVDGRSSYLLCSHSARSSLAWWSLPQQAEGCLAPRLRGHLQNGTP